MEPDEEDALAESFCNVMLVGARKDRRKKGQRGKHGHRSGKPFKKGRDKSRDGRHRSKSTQRGRSKSRNGRSRDSRHRSRSGKGRPSHRSKSRDASKGFRKKFRDPSKQRKGPNRSRSKTRGYDANKAGGKFRHGKGTLTDPKGYGNVCVDCKNKNSEIYP